MKKIFPLVLLVLLTTSGNSQLNQPAPTQAKVDYLKKSRHQKLTAWALLGGGVITWLAGFSKNMNQNDAIDGGGEVAMITGGLAVISSIPFYIMASKNKKKAVTVRLNMKNVPALVQQLAHKSYGSLSIHISFP